MKKTIMLVMLLFGVALQAQSFNFNCVESTTLAWNSNFGYPDRANNFPSVIIEITSDQSEYVFDVLVPEGLIANGDTNTGDDIDGFGFSMHATGVSGESKLTITITIPDGLDFSTTQEALFASSIIKGLITI